MGKKILFSIMTIASVALLIGGGTYAYFSDTETAEDNTFEAGTLNLKVGSADPCTENISIGSSLKPGDSGNAASWLMTNSGSIAGNLSISVFTITSNENTCYEMETDAGDAGTGEGELEDQLEVAIWVDKNTDGWNSGDYYLKTDGSTQAHQDGDSGLPAAAYNTLISYESATWSNVQTSVTGDIGTFYIEYDLPGATTDNTVQSDNCTFDITFTLNQDQSS